MQLRADAGVICWDHFMQNSIKLRSLTASDCSIVSDHFAAQGWKKPLEQYQRYWQESLGGKRDVILAELNGLFAGYVTVVWQSDYPPFRQAGIPEIVDFNVLIKFRRMGIGTALMDEAERRIALRSPSAGLGVCLPADYGPAQALYARRGYVPDGHGVYYQGRYPACGETVRLDDDLALYMIRQLELDR